MTHTKMFRAQLIAALRRELVGPEWLPDAETSEQKPDTDVGKEVLQESPVQRYTSGVLFPTNQPLVEIEDADSVDGIVDVDASAAPDFAAEEEFSELSSGGVDADDLGDAYDETVRMANEFYPSAIGLSFVAEIPESGLVIQVRAATYTSKAPADPNAKLREWHRTPHQFAPLSLVIPVGKSHGVRTFDVFESLKARAIYHLRSDGSYLVTVCLLNVKTSSGDRFPSGSDCFFQTEFKVTASDNSFAFPEYRESSRPFDDPEEAALELLYRNRRAYAVGHGCSADWGEESGGRTNQVRTATVPAFEVAPVLPRDVGGDELSMYFLSGAEGAVNPSEVTAVLQNVVDDYESWIVGQEQEASLLHARFQAAAENNLNNCRECLDRIRAGLDLLVADRVLLTAFMYANRVMLMQQYHARRPKRSIRAAWEELPNSYKPTDPDFGRWRTFQLAFILMNLTSILRSDPSADHADRSTVDLIWFPTGGGKTEAYLGLAACDIFYRRLCNPKNAGCTVLMRYTLRLLTAQQFQRASSMICACELMRRKDPAKLGDEPITIGLWVGQSLTPNHRQEALKSRNRLADKEKQAENPFQLLKCPWCGTELDNRRHLGYTADGRPKTVIFKCPESNCEFSTRSGKLPVLVIDEDVYANPPTLLIGTVDKFAMLAWREQARTIFGIGTTFDPPDLVIQDELHLISGPLGSVVGLYEGIIDLLCSWRGRRPKIVASTATIRRAPEQCKSLYDRATIQFPPQGLDISDSFFAAENSTATGRIYVGVFPSASPSFVTGMIRTLSSLFQSCKSLDLPAGAGEDTRDPYWTVLQYFNSLRELGHAATLVEADIPEYMWAIASRDRIPKEKCRRYLVGEELTSRKTADEIPKILDRLEVKYPRQTEDDPYPLDTLLATNMISVGVDVPRLGLMVVSGQPKTTSEYIQATSRVGRSAKAPGLVVAMYNTGKPRDRSHYEHFRAYHSAFYMHVEPTSVTPYSVPVVERALHAVLVIAARLLGGVSHPDAIDPQSSKIQDVIEYLRARCDHSEPSHAEYVKDKLEDLLSSWGEFRPSQWGGFGDPPESEPLMYPAGSEPNKEWNGEAWATPSSMRNVDVECLARVVSTYPEPLE
ncbi:MAG: helicase-related protein [Pirellulaceae bacterium]